jgi:hypothetical protein
MCRGKMLSCKPQNLTLISSPALPHTHTHKDEATDKEEDEDEDHDDLEVSEIVEVKEEDEDEDEEVMDTKGQEEDEEEAGSLIGESIEQDHSVLVSEGVGIHVDVVDSEVCVRDDDGEGNVETEEEEEEEEEVELPSLSALSSTFDNLVKQISSMNVNNGLEFEREQLAQEREQSFAALHQDSFCAVDKNLLHMRMSSLSRHDPNVTIGDTINIATKKATPQEVQLHHQEQETDGDSYYKNLSQVNFEHHQSQYSQATQKSLANSQHSVPPQVDHEEEQNDDAHDHCEGDYVYEGNDHHTYEDNDHHTYEDNDHHMYEGNDHHMYEGNDHHMYEGNDHHIYEGNDHHIYEGNDHSSQGRVSEAEEEVGGGDEGKSFWSGLFSCASDPMNSDTRML